jgi:coenzyme F420-reducing hydrogenase gamma subunit
MTKQRVAIHKFSSCDGCQLAFLNAGAALLELAQLVDLVHFAEAGAVQPDAAVDVAFVEGSITTAYEIERIQNIRAHTKYLVTIGACATSGGIQALRNGKMQGADWIGSVYASPQFISSLDTSTAIAKHVKVDYELWGCPVTTCQVLQLLRDLLFAVRPNSNADAVCLDCKRAGHVCVLVARGEPCMGPVTRTGCGALCPAFGRACYACFGPSEQVNGRALGQRLSGLGLTADAVKKRFQFINVAAEAYHQAAVEIAESDHDRAA